MKTKILFAGVIFLIAVWSGNSNLLIAVDPDKRPRLLSHRGVHQTFAGGTPGRETCTANPIHAPRHSFIENTIPSMRAAFDHGAEVVELDVHLTPDGVFAVFHDWTLDCRTDGTGQTNETPFDTLQKLDVGHGYSADGVSFPLRGSGVGMIPRIEEVFETFPTRQFLINFKSDRRREGVAFAEYLNVAAAKGQVFGVYGGAKPTRAVQDAIPEIRGFDRHSVRTCLIRYAGLGWSGYVPRACRDTLLLIPVDYAPFLWGWPGRFERRMKRYGTDIILAGPLAKGGAVIGIDSRNDMGRIPAGFGGYVWTNRIEIVGKPNPKCKALQCFDRMRSLIRRLTQSTALAQVGESSVESEANIKFVAMLIVPV